MISTRTVHIMVCVRHLLVLILVGLGLAFSTASYGQVIDKTDPEEMTDKSFDATFDTSEDSPEFTFEMPEEFQTDLPQDKARVAPKPKPKKAPLFSLGFLGPIFQLIFYGLLAFAVAYIVYLIVNTIIATRRGYVKADKSEDVPDIPVYQPDAKTAKVLLDDADSLAAQGKFAEAVHILLYRSIQDIEKSRPHHVKRSLTSREIAGLSILTPKAKDVFSQIGKLVENSFFGGGTLGLADYEASKEAYKAFAYENVTHTKPVRGRR